MLVAGVLLRAPYPGWLAGMASVDAVARVGLGLWFLLVPGLHSFVTTRIFVLVIVCISALLLGVVDYLSFPISHSIESRSALPSTGFLKNALAPSSCAERWVWRSSRAERAIIGRSVARSESRARTAGSFKLASQTSTTAQTAWAELASPRNASADAQGWASNPAETASRVSPSRTEASASTM